MHLSHILGFLTEMTSDSITSFLKCAESKLRGGAPGRAGRKSKPHGRTAGDGEIALAAVARFFLKVSLLSKEGAYFSKMSGTLLANKVYFKIISI